MASTYPLLKCSKCGAKILQYPGARFTNCQICGFRTYFEVQPMPTTQTSSATSYPTETAKPTGNTSAEKKTWTIADFETLRREAEELQETENGRIEVSQFSDVFNNTDALATLLALYYSAWRAGSLEKKLYDLILVAVNEPGTVPNAEKYATSWLIRRILAREATSPNSQDAMVKQGEGASAVSKEGKEDEKNLHILGTPENLAYQAKSVKVAEQRRKEEKVEPEESAHETPTESEKPTDDQGAELPQETWTLTDYHRLRNEASTLQHTEKGRAELRQFVNSSDFSRLDGLSRKVAPLRLWEGGLLAEPLYSLMRAKAEVWEAIPPLEKYTLARLYDEIYRPHEASDVQASVSISEEESTGVSSVASGKSSMPSDTWIQQRKQALDQGEIARDLREELELSEARRKGKKVLYCKRCGRNAVPDVRRVKDPAVSGIVSFFGPGILSTKKEYSCPHCGRIFRQNWLGDPKED